MLTWQTSLLPLPFKESLECWNQRNLCHANLHLCSPDRHHYFHFLSKNLWNVEINGFCVMQTYIRLLCWIFCAERISRFVPQSACALSRYWNLEKRLLGNYANESGCTYCIYIWEELDKPKEFAAQGQGLRRGRLQRFPPWADRHLALLSTYCKHGWNKGRESQHPVSLWSKTPIASRSRTLPLELNDSTLSSSCLKAVSPRSMLHAAYSLRGCSQPSVPLRKAVQKSTSVVGLLRTSSNWILESCHSLRLEHVSLDRLLLQYCVAMAFEFGSWMSAALVGPTLTWQTSLLPLPSKESLECWNQRILCHANLHPTVMLNLLCRANLTLCPPICLCFIEILKFGEKIAW